MAFIPVPNGVRVALEQSLDGQLVVNVYYVDKPAPIITADLTTIATIFRDWWIGDLSVPLANDLALNAVVATDVSIEGGSQVTLTASLPAIGGSAVAAVPNNVALCVTRYTLFTGRSRRGRSYYAGLTEGIVTNNTVVAPQLATILAAQGQLSLDLQAAGFRWVVASFVSGGVPRVTADVRGVASFAANNRVDTQRRRLPGEGA